MPRLEQIQKLIPLIPFTEEDAQRALGHIQEQWLYEPGRTRLICSLLGTMYEELHSRPDLQQLVLELVLMAGKLREGVAQQDWRHVLRSSRIQWIKPTLAEYAQRQLDTVVEIGSIRSDGTMQDDGFLTLAWAMHCKCVYTVDIDELHCKRFWNEHYAYKYRNVQAVASDGAQFLKHFDRQVDLLVLDLDSAEKTIECFLAAQDKLGQHSLVLIDDTHLNGLGVIPLALEAGFVVIFAEYMTLLGRPFAKSSLELPRYDEQNRTTTTSCPARRELGRRG